MAEITKDGGVPAYFADKTTTLKLERQRKGLTIAALARIAWMNSADLSRIERGKLIPSYGQAKRIAAAIGWKGSVEELFEAAGARE